MPSPILILPGIGGSILVKHGHEKKRIFKEHIIDNRWMNISPLSTERMNLWQHDNSARLKRSKKCGTPLGIEQNEPHIKPYPGIEGVCGIVPEFELLAKPYQDLLNVKFNYKYFQGFVDAAVATKKFKPNENLRAMPYDFRRVLDPHFRETLFCEMKQTVEDMFNKEGRPVVIVGHSLGAIMFKWFLSVKVDANWARKYVKRFFVVNAPFGGSSTALKAILSGEYFVPIFSKQFHAGLQLNSGIIMCFPNAYGYMQNEQLAIVDKIGVITPATFETQHSGFNFHAADAFDTWYELYRPHLNFIMEPVDVATHIVTSNTSLDTLKTFRIREVGGGDVEEISYENGDGQVSARSLAVGCDLFHGAKMMKSTIDMCHHISIICDPRFARLVLNEAETKA